MDLLQIALIEELAANAWPAAITQRVDGWLLRFNWGVTSRANSVWPNAADGRLSLDEKLAAVDTFYARRQAPVRFQLCPAARPSGLVAELAARGYSRASEERTCVQIAPLARVVERTEERRRGRVTVSDRCKDEWFTCYCRISAIAGQNAAVRRDLLERIGPASGYALLHLDGAPAAVGLGVAERGWLGLFCMATDPAFRRQGAACAVLHALAGWGRERGAGQIYLQVVETNTPACAAYARAGFETLYHYHYFRAPESGPDPQQPLIRHP